MAISAQLAEVQRQLHSGFDQRYVNGVDRYKLLTEKPTPDMVIQTAEAFAAYLIEEGKIEDRVFPRRGQETHVPAHVRVMNYWDHGTSALYWTSTEKDHWRMFVDHGGTPRGSYMWGSATGDWIPAQEIADRFIATL